MKKYYVVWVGRETGVYHDLQDAMEHVDNYPCASLK
ncbi:MAG: RNase H1/viroplasmin domain-containing protein, partial [Muribaculaceae bacterium]|nr:RNase H1/viroplasmin domain-containing protein [Muribaculaceae bacterium]